MKLAYLLATILAIFTYARCAWTIDHLLTEEASKQVADGVKATLLANLNQITNKAAAQAIKNDLNQSDDSKRILTSLDIITAGEIFKIFGLKDPGCDKNDNGEVEGDELKCLNKIWKYFVPK